MKNKNSNPTNQIATTFSISEFSFCSSLYACICW